MSSIAATATPVDAPEPAPHQADEAGSRRETAQLGMWIFLASEVLFFGALILAYAIARLQAPTGFAAASAHTQLAIGTLNTAVLLTSSLAVALGAEAARAGQRASLARWFWIASALGIAFLLLKVIEYRLEWTEGLFPGRDFRLPPGTDPPPRGAQLFFAWYFVVTGLHALHLAIGIALCAGFAVAARSSRPERAAAPRVETVALYWHFVDLVWVVLYPLIYLVAPRS